MSAPAWYQSALAALRPLLAASPVPEDAGHAPDVEAWLLKIRPQAKDDWALRLAAWAHDLERALPDEQRVRREDFADYDDFKAAHAGNSARAAAALLRQAEAPAEVIRDVTWLIIRHEKGAGDARLIALRDADSLSFFSHNLAHYLAREGEAEALRRMRWGRSRLSPHGRRLLAAYRPSEPKLQQLLDRLRGEEETHPACR